ncbi:MAG: ComEC/Rec2 family competence protein [Pedobacter sp.]
MPKSRFVTSSEIFYLRAIIPFAAGIMFLKLCPLAAITPLLVILITGSLIVLITTLNLWYLRLKVYRYKSLMTCGFYLMLFVIGYALAFSKSELLHEDHFSNGNFKHLKIVVNQEPQIRNGILMFNARVIKGYENQSQKRTTGNLLVSIKIDSGVAQRPSYGDVLVIPNVSKTTVTNPNPATFNYKSWLAAQHIHHQAFLHQQAILVTNENKGNYLIKLALDLRAREVRYYRKILKDDNVYSVASTLILGYRADLDEEVLSYYAKTGTIHALSVSGMHVGLIYVVLDYIFSFLNRRQITRVFKLAIILLLIWSYTLLTGVSPSVLRASIMISGFIIGKGVNRTSGGINILAFSAFLILIHDPYILWDVGFQLSYLAVLGLILLHPIIDDWFYFKKALFRKIWSALSISLSAQLFTFPLSIYYFHQFPTYFLISNLFILLPVTGIMYLGILVLLFRLSFLAELLEWLIRFTNSGLKFVADLPFSSVSSVWITPLELLLLTLSIAGVLFALTFYKKPLLLYALALLLMLQTLSSVEKINKLGQRKLVIFNVRNHYAVAFIISNEAILFTNLRADDKIFKRNIQPFMDREGISTIICTDDLSSIKRHYLTIQEDDIRFYDHLISGAELEQFKIGLKNAIIKKID